ncbi:methyl-accepting chemotaxis protein [Alkalihalobacillus sp. LMS39]|uniref:methyl-accepting chemotaxis protein n=1 Tax=Alkalihalobacillus sp. LMS39 TaxID=2924032 RepID=UPI001FB406EA|nr:methyl-accepting chemotaxis protein [Alkalihalobacillus sp. LMS39]UOE94536.1 methyl-accepting chemotaxis protein [Alkalihalobacillus sp. LMS39]
MKTKDYSFEARNWLLIKLYILSVVLTAIILFAGGLPLITNIIGTAFGVVTVVIVFTMHKVNKNVNWIPYILIISLALMTVFMLENRPAITTYLLAYYSIIIISLYHNFRYVIVSGVFGLFITNYFAINFGEQTIVGYTNVHLASFNILFILMTTFLIAQCRIGQNIQKDVEVLADEAVTSNEQMEGIIVKVRETVSMLEELTLQLSDHSESSATYSKELAATFNEIAGGVGSQAQSASEMSESLHSVDQEIDGISVKAKTMKENASSTSEVVANGSEKVKQLHDTIQTVNETLQISVEEMGELNSSTSKVGEIVNTISEIADQTNLLALNAAIEAARAGESGKGFAVVAQEVRKLAEHSIQSTHEIGTILSLIQEKAKSATTRVQESGNTFKFSKQLTEETDSAFHNIEQNVLQLQTLSTEVDKQVESLGQSSEKVVDEVNSVSSVSEQLHASVQEVFASVEDNNHKISTVNEKVKEMNEVTEQLKQLVQR